MGSISTVHTWVVVCCKTLVLVCLEGLTEVVGGGILSPSSVPEGVFPSAI